MELHKHFKLNSMLQYITVILFIVSTTVNADITPKYDNEAGKMRFYDVLEDKTLTLVCKSSAKLHWTKNGAELSNVPVLKDEHGSRYEIKDNSLIIKRLLFEDDGKYICSNPDTKETAEINVVANVYIKKLPENLSVVEGEKMRIHCNVLGTDPVVTWRVAIEEDQENLQESDETPRGFDGKIYVPINDSRASYQDYESVKNATLVLNATVLSDRGRYNCTATNMATESGIQKYKPVERGCYVRVKGKLAALWPFLGICAEVLILCAIILVYEKRRNKEGMDESDTDQSPEQEKLKTGK